MKVSIRPSDVAVEPVADEATTAAVVQDSVLVGGHVEMKIAGGGEEVLAHVPRSSGLAPGRSVRLTVDSERVRVFAEG